MKAKDEDEPYETRADINANDEPTKFFQVASQRFGVDGSFAHDPELEQAVNYPVPLKGRHEMYKFALEIDGESAGPPMGFIYERDERGVYTLRVNEFSRL